MILTCRADSVHNFKEYVRQIVEQENALGERLKYDKQLLALVGGLQELVLFYDDEDLEKPVFVLIVRKVYDRAREEEHLIIDNLLVPDRDKLIAYADKTSEDRERFTALCKPYDKVYFWTRNEKVLDLVERLGIFFDPTSVMFEMRR